MPQRFSLLFTVTTEPLNPNDASPHSGSWSEQHWDFSGGKTSDGPEINGLANTRALMLPTQAQIIGWRIAQYAIAGNKLVPGGTTTVKRRYPGSAGYTVNIPQEAMQMSYTVAGAPNASRFRIKCVPDEVIAQGEFNGNGPFKTKMTNYGNALVNNNWGAVVRELAAGVSFRVLSLVNRVLTLDSNPGAVIGQFMRLRRVVDAVTGRPISGSFHISAATSSTVTLDGIDAGAVAGTGGFCRIDLASLVKYATIKFDRVVGCKIGGPFERYRGRRSKVRR